LPSTLDTVRHLAKVVAAAALAWAMVIVGLLLWPPESQPRHADAVMVLAGDHGERLPLALKLLHEGVANTLVFDGTPDSRAAQAMCHEEEPFPVVCLDLNPDSTAAEARAASSLSKTRHWRSFIVVTTNDHVLRARMRFGRCFRGTFGVEGAPLPTGLGVKIRALEHEWFGVVAATLVDRGC
jgi:uncharacterized SAM-binding protein YcdF (DUF218 family)